MAVVHADVRNILKRFDNRKCSLGVKMDRSLNLLRQLLVLLRTLRWQRREGSSKFKDAFKIAFTTSASIIVVALVMLLAVATGFMLYFSHQYVQLLPLLSYLAPLIVCVIRVCIKMRKEDQPWWPIVFLLVLLVYGTLEVILLLLTLKPNIERNAVSTIM